MASMNVDEPESNNPTQTEREDEEDFGTVRAYFDNDEHFSRIGIVIVVIGKLYDHMVELYGYGDGERQRQYEQVLRKIKDVLLSPEPDPDSDDEDDAYLDSDFCRESLEGAETTLMSIANAKTNTTETEGQHRHQNSNNDEDHIAGMAEKFPDDDLFLFSHLWYPLSFRRRARALWVVFQHLVKMDDGNCTSLYTSVLSHVYNVIYLKEEIATTVDKLVRKLDAIVDVKRGRLTEQEVMMGDNASAVTFDDVHLSLKDTMRWAMSNRLIIQEANFWDEKYEIRSCFKRDEWNVPFEVVDLLYDHIEELDGGRFRYEYIKAFRELFKQLRSTGGGDDYWIDQVQDIFKHIAIKKMDITEMEYQKILESVEFPKMSYNDIVKFKTSLDEIRKFLSLHINAFTEEFRKMELLPNQINLIYHHLLILDDYECSDEYSMVLDTIKDVCVLTSLRITSWQLAGELREEVYILNKRKNDSLREALKEIAQKKKNNRSNTISKQKENTLAATTSATEEASSSTIVIDCYTAPNHGDAEVPRVLQPRHRWLDSSEILQILQDFENYRMSKEIQQKPPSGSVILYDTKLLRFYKKDGYNWKKQKDGQTVTEGHMRLKVEGKDKLHCYYAHSEDDDKFQRRTYSLLNKTSSIRLVHYLDSKVEYSKESENVGREAEDTALDVTRHNRIKSVGTSSRIIKRPRGDPDGDDMNKEIDNQAYFPRNANRTMSANTSPLDDEMALLAKEVGSLPGFEKGSDWFFLAMLSFKDEKNKALFKAMEDLNSKARMLTIILNI